MKTPISKENRRFAKMVVNRGKRNSSIFRATLPPKFIRYLGLSEEKRDIVIELQEDEDRITIKKKGGEAELITQEGLKTIKQNFASKKTINKAKAKKLESLCRKYENLKFKQNGTTISVILMDGETKIDEFRLNKLK